MKKFLVLIVVFIMLAVVSVPDVIAGNKQRHRWEGIGIGVGSLIILDQIFRNNRGDHRQEPCDSNRGYRFGRPAYHSQQVWIPAVRERVWYPAHYDQLGRWVRGEWVTRELAPGYWGYR